MADRYNLRLSRQDQQLYLAWHQQDPVSAIESLKHERTAALTGRSNPFVSGEKQWQLGFKTSGIGLTAAGWQSLQSAPAIASSGNMPDKPLHGNRNSKIYHRPDCPNYMSMAPANRLSPPCRVMRLSVPPMEWPITACSGPSSAAAPRARPPDAPRRRRWAHRSGADRRFPARSPPR